MITGLFVYNSFSSLLGMEPFPVQWEAREILEAATALILMITSGTTIYQFRKFYLEYGAMEQKLSLASGSATSIVETQFTKWQLSASERVVATYILKGMTNKEIAELTGKKEGTIKSQCNAVFRKAGLKNRSQLNSFFFEFLIMERD
jgi:DNA-binding NarL/FixJ family response regulator